MDGIYCQEGHVHVMDISSPSVCGPLVQILKQAYRLLHTFLHRHSKLSFLIPAAPAMCKKMQLARARLVRASLLGCSVWSFKHLQATFFPLLKVKIPDPPCQSVQKQFRGSCRTSCWRS